jgi:hypothetical protein
MSKALKQIKEAVSRAQTGIVLKSDEPHYVKSSLMSVDNLLFLMFDQVKGLQDRDRKEIRLKPKISDEQAELMAEYGNEVEDAPHTLLSSLRLVIDMIKERKYRADHEEEIPEDSKDLFLWISNFDNHLMPNGSQGNPDLDVLECVLEILRTGPTCRTFLLMETGFGWKVYQKLEPLVTQVSQGLPLPEEAREILLSDLGEYVSEKSLCEKALNSLAGLSRGASVEVAASCVTDKGNQNDDPKGHFVFDIPYLLKAKADHCGHSKVAKVWNAAGESNFNCEPTPAASELIPELTDKSKQVTLIGEDNSANSDCDTGEVKVTISHNSVDPDTGKRKNYISRVGPIKKTEFESTFNPDRKPYGIHRVMGWQGLTDFVCRGRDESNTSRCMARMINVVGAPGLGKTHFIKNIAAYLKMSVISPEMSQITNSLVGETGKGFQKFVDLCYTIGGIVFFDEVDKLAFSKNKTDDSNGINSDLKRQLLLMLQDLPSQCFVITAANSQEGIDPAIVRSGRSDTKTWFAGWPGREQKDQLWSHYCDIHDLAEQEKPNDAFWTPADIAQACKSAEQQRRDLTDPRLLGLLPGANADKVSQAKKYIKSATKGGWIDVNTGFPVTMELFHGMEGETKKSIEPPKTVSVRAPKKVTRRRKLDNGKS